MPRDAVAVSAGSSIAAGVAMDVLRAGGGAVDAAIAGSAAQCVVEMPWCGLGGDAFALVRSADGTVLGFNGSGAAPAAVLDVTAALDKVPRFGPASVAVPAVVDAWVELHERYGTVAFAELLEPARRLAADGFVLDDRLARTIANAPSLENGDQLASLLAGARIAAGEPFFQRDLAESLVAIAADGRDSFYGGVLGKRIVDHLADRGGALSLEDLAGHRGAWTAPAGVTYRGARVWSNGLVSSGVLLLLGLRVLDAVWPGGPPDDEVAVVDTLVRLKQLLFGSIAPRLGDPEFAEVPDVVVDDVVRAVAADLRASVVRPAGVAAPPATDTTSLAVAGPDGATVCFIHSLFNEFGSRELVADTGIVLNDRLANLVVPRPGEPVGANALGPGKRPLHTLHGYVVEWPDGRAVAGATPGGRGQIQTNLQVLVRLIDRGAGLPAAVAAPRWVHGMPRSSADDDTLYIEPELAHLAPGLAARGHLVEVVSGESTDRFGNCTVVGVTADGVEAAADHRRGGKALQEP